ncbi:biotin-dependent carboxyltransferase family protein [Liquorilactobacillus mali]|uniref:5-oxoprolinase subunit C family protein n=1 Tax=Liquorilactobacillus mali TaxID=1618 RepID=UPI002650578C|nr:biotin-dependent carboxyltransferase family protein [Liquorilactobacillus mali]MDN7144772.1 biotin-dependent carboxyltransferase family protein [Liquorilactobacillus mali]
MPHIEIINSGLAATIQDLGRTGHQAKGIPVSGAIDQYSHRLANVLVNNSEKSATLEFSILGPTIEFNVETFIAITGGDSAPILNDSNISLNTTYPVKKGDILAFHPMKSGRFGYIAFAGNGLQVEPILGSRSTNTRLNLGGYHGRALAKGDCLTIDNCYQMPSLANRSLPWSKPTGNSIRFIKGPQWNLFSESAKQVFKDGPFTISTQADRMGFRLDGPTLEIPQKNMLSEGAVLGNIQITRAGQPIVLLADRQTAGGYPVIATIIGADLGKFVQFASNSPLLFEEVSLKKATAALRSQYRFLGELADSIYQKRYQYPIGPIRKTSKKIEEMIFNS